MNEPVNPFAAPRDSAGVDGPVAIVQAGQGARLINLIVDYLGQAGVGIVIGVVAALVGGEAAIEAIEQIPDLALYDALWVMGGPMDVWDVEEHPWLIPEKAAIRRWVGELQIELNIEGTRI